MEKRNLYILLAVSLLAGLAAWVSVTWTGNRVQRVAETHRFLPELAPQVANINSIELATASAAFTLIKDAKDGQWRVREKHNYPADANKISALVAGMLGITALEPRTADPKRHQELGLEDPPEASSRVLRVTLQDAQEKVLASVILGKQRRAAGGAAQQFYLRHAGADQTWLATGNFNPDRAPRDWIDRSLIDISHDRIRQVTIRRPGGEESVISRNAPGEELHLRDLPPGHKENQQKINATSYGMQDLPINDVYLRSDLAELDWSTATEVRFETFDGLFLQTLVLPTENFFYLQLKVTYDQETGRAFQQQQAAAPKQDSPPTLAVDTRPVEEIAAEITEIQQGFEPWIFLLPGHTVDTFIPSLDELAPLESPAKPPAP